MRNPTENRKTIVKKTLAAVLTAAGVVLGAIIQILILVKTVADYMKLRYVEFVPRPDDIFIATYPRSGTTWMQMLLYQLTSDGKMDMAHIAQHCPWFERS